MGLGSGIQDPEKTYSGSLIQGSKRHRIPEFKEHFRLLLLFSLHCIPTLSELPNGGRPPDQGIFTDLAASS
jgi:hypothetical protein